MRKFTHAGSKRANSKNASEYYAFQPSIIMYRLFHVTCLAHGKRRSVRQMFLTINLRLPRVQQPWPDATCVLNADPHPLY
jgi:hypothetical protein